MVVELLPGLNVSRETERALRSLEALLEKWNRTINLVSKSTIAFSWDRHIIDSAQLYPDFFFSNWVDLGSGGGFPGLVIAILSRELCPAAKVTLVEADLRKATFLREAIRFLDLTACVITERIEHLSQMNADILSARALAPFNLLCGFADRHLAEGGFALFPKGAGWRSEVEIARKHWNFNLEVCLSKTDSSAVVLKVRGLRHV